MRRSERGAKSDYRSRISNFLHEFRKQWEIDNQEPAKNYREEFYVDINQNIGNVIFFDCGITKPYKTFEQCVEEPLDGIFETIVSDPRNDEILFDFLTVVRSKYEKVDPKKYRNSEELRDDVTKLVEELIKEVDGFFGSRHEKSGEEIENECALRIQMIKAETKKNLVYLGQLKGCGECRHRSILFKLLSDIFNIKCRILRGMVKYQGKDHPHSWNEIVLKTGKERYLVDCMNLLLLPIYSVSAQETNENEENEDLTRLYRNLGHPFQDLEGDLLTVKNVQKMYKSSKGKKIGSGSFGKVFDIERSTIFVPKKRRKEKEGPEFARMKHPLVSKEIEINPQDSDDLKKERVVHNEIQMMRLLKHPDIARFYGHFTSDQEDGTRVVNVIMEKYDCNARQYIEIIKKRLHNHVDRLVESLILLTRVARGLSHLHSFGLVHLDIKPENILVNYDKRTFKITDVRLADFGSTKEEDIRLTMTSTIRTSERYTDCELVLMISKIEKCIAEGNKTDELGNVLSFKNDIYSFGVLINDFRDFLLISQTMSFLGDAGYQLIQAINRMCFFPLEDRNLTAGDILGDFLVILSRELPVNTDTECGIMAESINTCNNMFKAKTRMWKSKIEEETSKYKIGSILWRNMSIWDMFPLYVTSFLLLYFELLGWKIWCSVVDGVFHSSHQSFWVLFFSPISNYVELSNLFIGILFFMNMYIFSSFCRNSWSKMRFFGIVFRRIVLFGFIATAMWVISTSGKKVFMENVISIEDFVVHSTISELKILQNEISNYFLKPHVKYVIEVEAQVEKELLPLIEEMNHHVNKMKSRNTRKFVDECTSRIEKRNCELEDIVNERLNHLEKLTTYLSYNSHSTSNETEEYDIREEEVEGEEEEL